MTFSAAGKTDPGRRRDVNEDRFHLDVGRGVVAVIDGVGGQAAGGKAADVALSMLRGRLEQQTGSVEERVREAITAANNQIYRLASSRPEWEGMACVLTVAVLEQDDATIGHVGDTRLYKVRDGRVEKITRDHSPVGEREDAHEISESQAMRHPRRNEVYRDVGSEPHQPHDEDFIDVQRVAFETDAALLLCSDGLSDLLSSSAIGQIVEQFAGDPQAVVGALIDAANDAGGKDNVTVVYVEGAQFARARVPVRRSAPAATPERHLSAVFAVLFLVLLGVLLTPTRIGFPIGTPTPVTALQENLQRQIVQPSESISDAIARAKAGGEVVVEPGEYRERLNLKNDVRVVSLVPRGATIRLPATAADDDPAVVADGLATAELSGFRIVGDAATPLGVGVSVRNSALAIVDVEITGATKVAIAFSDRSAAGLVGSSVHDNPGAALLIDSGASPRIAHNAFARNGTAAPGAVALMVAGDAKPQFVSNVFHGMSAYGFAGLDDTTRATLTRDNWFFVAPQQGRSPVPASRRQGR
jgi:PPM family protein phosphatase